MGDQLEGIYLVSRTTFFFYINWLRSWEGFGNSVYLIVAHNLTMHSLIDLLGILGFVIAAYTFIKTQLIKSKIEIIAGPSFTIYYTSDGGTGIYMPIAYINDSDRAGKILNTLIHLTLPQELGRFSMRWADFVSHDAKAKGYNHLDHSRSFSVQGQTVIDKFIWFVWRSYNKKSLDFVPGEYSLEIEIETSISKKRNKIFKYAFKLTSEDISFLDIEKALKTNGTRTVTFENYNRENTFE